MTDTIPERVARGVALLDEKHPGWWERIDVDRLNLRSGCNCVLGQTWDGDYAGSSTAYMHHLDALLPEESYRDYEFGFDAEAEDGEEQDDEYDALTAEWRRVILARRGGEDALYLRTGHRDHEQPGGVL